LDKISKNRERKIQVFKQIEQSVIKSPSMPREEIFQYLEINKELTAALQSKKLYEKDQEKVFLREFHEILNVMLSESGLRFQDSFNPAEQFLKNNQSYLPQEMVYRSLNILGYEQLRSNNTEKAKDIFRMCEKHSPSYLKYESHFLLLWCSLFTDNYDEALKTITEFNMLGNFDSYSPRVRFWITYTLQKKGETILAKNYYKKIIEENPLDYYAILAMKNLKKIGDITLDDILTKRMNLKPLAHYLELNSLRESAVSTLTRAILWLDLGRESFFKMEMNSLLEKSVMETVQSNASQLDPDLYKSWLIFNILRLLNKKDYFLTSFRLAFDCIDKNYIRFSLPALKTLFPMNYFEKIKGMAPGVDPILILSLIRQESAFNTHAVSAAGAMGLMQVMPFTAKYLNKHIKKSELQDPNVNLQVGIAYFKKLLAKYGGNLVLTLSAYNAGEKRLNTWIKNYFFNKDPHVMVESIPFEETKNYVKLIFRNIFFYRYLTNDPGMFLPVEDSFVVMNRKDN
jgi:soluble lytic murein transglycosylase